MTDTQAENKHLQQEFAQDVQKMKDRNVLVEVHEYFDNQRSYLQALRIFVEEKKKAMDPDVLEAVVQNRFVAEISITAAKAHEAYQKLQTIQNLDAIEAQWKKVNTENVRSLSSAEKPSPRKLRTKNRQVQ